LNQEFEATPGYYLKPSKYSQIGRFFAIRPIEIPVVLDETRLLKAKNLVYCLNELEKRAWVFSSSLSIAPVNNREDTS